MSARVFDLAEERARRRPERTCLCPPAGPHECELPSVTVSGPGGTFHVSGVVGVRGSASVPVEVLVGDLAGELERCPQHDVPVSVCREVHERELLEPINRGVDTEAVERAIEEQLRLEARCVDCGALSSTERPCPVYLSGLHRFSTLEMRALADRREPYDPGHGVES